MKGVNIVYYLLFMLLIMGAFASMAQNNYGTGILAGVSIAFAVVFIYLLFTRSDAGKTGARRLELAALFLLAVLIAIRLFNIHGIVPDGLFLSALGLLMVIYVLRMYGLFTAAKLPRPQGAMASLFYCIAVLFLLGLFFSGFRPELTGIAGLTALVLLFIWIAMAWITRRKIVDGIAVAPLAGVTRSGSEVVPVVVFFLLASLYITLTRFGLIPQMYTDQLPRSYFELVNEAESGKDKRVDGKFKYERFKEAYDRFLEDSRNRER